MDLALDTTFLLLHVWFLHQNFSLYYYDLRRLYSYCFLIHSNCCRYSISYLGFGMALSRPYKLIWSHLGFNILIAALSIQTFFLVNAFWTKAGIYHNSPFNTQSYFVGLIPTDINNPGTNSSQGANLNEALKCALACIIAFSFVIGRAGLLDLYVLTTTGTVVYELARQVCINNYP